MTSSRPGRTIEQILAIRLRAAQLRVLERTTALVKEQHTVEQSWGHQRDEDEHSTLLDAKRLADEALVLVQREIDSQQGLPVDPVPYEPADGIPGRRYAAVLMAEDPGLDAETALAQARQDEHTRFEDWQARYGQHDDEDDTDEDTDQ